MKARWTKVNSTTEKMIIGMVHLDALPGTPLFSDDLADVYQKALNDAAALAAGGVTALMIENAGDIPYPKKLAAVQTACLAAITKTIKDRTHLPVGIDAAFCDYEAALASAMAAGADFIRLAVFSDSVLTASGLLEACAEKALRCRKMIGAENIKIYADIQVKYSHLLIPELSIEESAKNAQASLADGIIVTGAYSGNETPLAVVQRVKKVVDLPVFIGSGLSEENVKAQMQIADGAIVGTSLKSIEQGKAVIDQKKVERLMNHLRGE